MIVNGALYKLQTFSTQWENRQCTEVFKGDNTRTSIEYDASYIVLDGILRINGSINLIINLKNNLLNHKHCHVLSANRKFILTPILYFLIKLGKRKYIKNKIWTNLVFTVNRRFKYQQMHFSYQLRVFISFHI